MCFMGKIRRDFQNDQRGVAVLELAVILPVLLVIGVMVFFFVILPLFRRRRGTSYSGRGSSGWAFLPVGGGGWSGGGSGGGFSGGGGSSGGGGASGSW